MPIVSTKDSCEKSNQIKTMCLHCGAMYRLEKERSDKCSVCGSTNIVLFTDELYDEWDAFYDEIEGRDKIDHANECMRKKYVYNNPDFDKEAYDAMLLDTAKLRERNAQIAREYFSSVRSSPRCPNCNSDDFDMVPRKWSLLTGFMTNKVDRVCRRCKKRF